MNETIERLRAAVTANADDVYLRRVLADALEEEGLPRVDAYETQVSAQSARDVGDAWVLESERWSLGRRFPSFGEALLAALQHIAPVG